MPCGGIYPVEDTGICWRCRKPGADHFVEEWDAYIHETCIIPFLHTDEGEIVVDHKHHIQIDMFVLQEEGGELMDPNETLKELRELIDSLRPLLESDDDSLDTGDVGEDLIELIDKFENLDGWLSNGGFAPTEWSKNRG